VACALLALAAACSKTPGTTSVADAGHDVICPLLPREAGPLQYEVHQLLRAGTPLALGDFDGDGRLDVLVLDHQATVMLNLPDGGLAAAGTAALLPPEAVADLDGDGRLDLLSATDQGNLILFRGGAGGALGPAEDIGPGLQGMIRSLVLADWNQDGRLDVAGALLNQGIELWLAAPDGGYELETLDHGVDPWYLAVADLNGDGLPDLAVADNNNNQGATVLGRKGQLNPPALVQAGANPFVVAVGDLNRDGHPDLVFANASSSDVFVELAVDGGFPLHCRFLPTTGARDMALADLDGDGQLDMAVAGEGLQVLTGTGDGTFRVAASTSWSSGVTGNVLIGDWDGDGRPDLIVGKSPGGVEVWLTR
jgi:hypothetical protein